MRLACTAALAGIALSVGVAPLPAHAATAAAVADIAVGERYEPRDADVLGVGETGFLYLREADVVPGGGLVATRVGRWHGSDGSDVEVSDVTEDTRDVGDRLVNDGSTTSETRLIGDSSWQPLPTVDGYTYLTSTADGELLLSGPADNEVVSLLPWSGGTPVALTGFPSGRAVAVPADGRARTTDAHGAILWAGTPDNTGNQYVYVDSSTGEAQEIPVAPSDQSSLISLGPNAIAWRSGQSGSELLSTLDRPAAHATFGAVTTRPAPAALDSLPTPRLLPVGDDVIVSSGWSWATRDSSLPMIAVAPDGAMTVLAAWGHNVQPSGADAVTAVTSSDPDTEAITTTSLPGGTIQQDLLLGAVPGRVTTVSVDTGRVVYTTDTAPGGGLFERSVSSTQGDVELGPERLLATGVTTSPCETAATPGSDLGCSPIRTGGGSTGYETLSDGTSSTVIVGSDGSTLLQDPTLQLDAVDGTWMRRSGGYPWTNITTGASVTPTGLYTNDELDHVVYSDEAKIGLPGIRSLALDTARVGEIDVPNACSAVGQVQVAGSWVYAVCGTAGNGRSYTVLDRTGVNASWSPDPGYYLLGNGFLVRDDGTGVVSWTDLSDTAHTWQTLASDLGTFGSVAVSRTDSTPFVAWANGITGHVAVLPVTPSPMPAHPTALQQPPAQPAAFQPHAGDGRIGLTWNPPDSSSLVEDYKLQYSTPTASTTVTLPKTAKSWTLTPATNGEQVQFQLYAENQWGRSPVASTFGTALAPNPLAPTINSAAVNALTSVVTVKWTNMYNAANEAPTRWVVSVGPYQLAVTSSTQASLFVPTAGTWPLTLTAYSADGSAQATSAPLTFPGADTTAPTISSTSLPPVTQSDRASFKYRGSDNRGWVAYDVRERSASLGHALGTWSVRWSNTTATSVSDSNIKPGVTHCYSVRARDASGNVSSWSPARCQTIALDDPSLIAGTGWWRSYSSHYYGGSVRTTIWEGARLHLNNVRANAVWIYATRCSTCGTVGVYDGSVLVRKISLYSSRWITHQFIDVTWSHHWSGTLTIKVLSSRKRVGIDGLALRAY